MSTPVILKLALGCIIFWVVMEFVGLPTPWLAAVIRMCALLEAIAFVGIQIFERNWVRDTVRRLQRSKLSVRSEVEGNMVRLTWRREGDIEMRTMGYWYEEGVPNSPVSAAESGVRIVNDTEPEGEIKHHVEPGKTVYYGFHLEDEVQVRYGLLLQKLQRCTVRTSHRTFSVRMPEEESRRQGLTELSPGDQLREYIEGDNGLDVVFLSKMKEFDEQLASGKIDKDRYKVLVDRLEDVRFQLSTKGKESL